MNSVNEKRFENWKKNIILFLSSQTVSLFGSALVQYAMMWYITLNTESGMMMTLFIICGIKVEWLLVGTGLLSLILSLFLGGNKVLLESGKAVVEEPAK